MIIQRKIELDVPNGRDNIYWEDLVTDDSVVVIIINYLKTLDPPIGTKYRIIHAGKTSIQYATVTQPPLPKKEIEWSKSK